MVLFKSEFGRFMHDNKLDSKSRVRPAHLGVDGSPGSREAEGEGGEGFISLKTAGASIYS